MTPFPLIEKLIEYFENFSSLITDNKISKEDFELEGTKNDENEKNNENDKNKENDLNNNENDKKNENDNNLIKNNEDSNNNKKNNVNNNNLIIKLKNKQNINMKKCFTDELGINNFISLEYNPKYICYIEDKPKTENSNNGKHLVILVEIPGTVDNFKYDLKLVDNNYKLNITGKKMLSKKLKIQNENKIFSTIEEVILL